MIYKFLSVIASKFHEQLQNAKQHILKQKTWNSIFFFLPQ